MGNLRNISSIYSKLDCMVDECVTPLKVLFHFRGDTYYHHDTGNVEVLMRDKLIFKDSSFERLLVYLDFLHIFCVVELTSLVSLYIILISLMVLL